VVVERRVDFAGKDQAMVLTASRTAMLWAGRLRGLMTTQQVNHWRLAALGRGPCPRSAAGRAAQTSGVNRVTTEHVTNRLDNGQRRFGWMDDGDPNTPVAPATLARTGQAVQLEIEW
jgi:hypothetical protein